MPSKTEAQLQYEIVVWFSQEFPDFRGLLFEVNNDTYNMKHAMKRRSMGMIKGISDLIFIIPNNGRIVGIELKANNSRHTKTHIQSQINWGKTLIENGGNYLITSSAGDVKTFINNLIRNYTEKVEALQNGWIKFVEDQYESKTIAF